MKGTFLASETRAVCRLMDSYAIDSKKHMREAGLNPLLLGDPRARFRLPDVVEFWSSLPILFGNSAVGLEIGPFWRATDAHALGYSLVASENIKTALQRLERYYQLVNDYDKYRVVTDQSCCALEWDKNGRAASGYERVHQDTRWSTLVALFRRCDEEINPSRVFFRYDRPVDTKPYTDYFKCEVIFNANVERIEYSVEAAELELSMSNPELTELNDRFLDDTLKAELAQTVFQCTKKCVAARLATGTPTVDGVARDMNMTPRTLSRRLAAENTNFTAALQDIRSCLAIKYIIDPLLPLTEVSYLLGFSDTSSFSRAFKQWTGCQPLAYRKQYLKVH